MDDPQQKKLAWSIYMKYPSAAAYLSKEEVKPPEQILEYLGELINRREIDFKNVTPPRRKRELWFVPCSWAEERGLRDAGAKETACQLLTFWFSVESNEEPLDLYLGIAPGAKRDNVTRLIAAVKNDASTSSKGIKVHDSPQTYWTHLWGRRFLTKEELNQENRDLVFRLIGEKWQNFLDQDLPKINDAVSVFLNIK